jgi:hypothetical protein
MVKLFVFILKKKIVEQFGDPNQLAHHQIELIWVQHEKYGFIFQPNFESDNRFG